MVVGLGVGLGGRLLNEMAAVEHPAAHFWCIYLLAHRWQHPPDGFFQSRSLLCRQKGLNWGLCITPPYLGGCPARFWRFLGSQVQLALWNLQKVISQFHLQMFNRFRSQARRRARNSAPHPVSKPASSSPGNGENHQLVEFNWLHLLLFSFFFACHLHSPSLFIYSRALSGRRSRLMILSTPTGLLRQVAELCLRAIKKAGSSGSVWIWL